MQRNRFIDFAKGIAIIFVLFNHYEWSAGNPVGTHFYYWVVSTAVPIFMLCTGYVTAASFSSKNIDLKTAYSKNQLLPKLLRYIMPVLWFYLAETLLTVILHKIGYLEYISNLGFRYINYYWQRMTPVKSVLFFFAGGRGKHGTYYFPIIMQVAVMIPLIFAVIKKWKHGIWLCFAINLLFEIVKSAIGLTQPVYRLLAFRYIFVLALGCYLYVYRNNPVKWYKWLVLFVAGAVYTYLINYTGYDSMIFTHWRRTSMISILYVAPVFLLGLIKLKNINVPFIEKLGKASYHILMVQIIYYNFFAPLVWKDPMGIIPNDKVGFLISFIVCLAGGYGYYILYNYVAGKYKARKNKIK